MSHIAIVVDWYGPYTYEEAKSAAKDDYGDGLYLVIGKKQGEWDQYIQYIGVSQNLLALPVEVEWGKMK